MRGIAFVVLVLVVVSSTVTTPCSEEQDDCNSEDDDEDDSDELPCYCLICQEMRCECRGRSCGPDGQFSLKKLVLHCVEKARRKVDHDEDVSRDDPYKLVVRVLKDILKRASRLTVNEETAIRDMIWTRLRVLRSKCPCLQESHETFIATILDLLLDKAREFGGEGIPCECQTATAVKPPDDGMHWFRTTDESLRKEIPRKECSKVKVRQRPRRVCRRRVQGKCETRNANPNRRCRDVDSSFKCPRFIGDESNSVCSEFSLCTDCDSCRVVVAKSGDDAWLECEGCRVINSPYVQFTEGGCPVKVRSPHDRKAVRIKTKYLQLNDFRPRPPEEAPPDRSDFECPNLSNLSQKRQRTTGR